MSAGSPATATVNITDDDVPTVTVRYEQSIYTVAEGSSVVIKVILSADPERTVTIPIPRSNQDGASNGDYSGVPTESDIQQRRHRKEHYVCGDRRQCGR